jgi:aryl-alcohol dehydrogenase-like predicted oxidoreductase
MGYGNAAAGMHQWTLDEDAAAPFFRQAVELGVTFWDTANVYPGGTSEEFVGRAITRFSRREDIVLASKVSGKMHDGPGGSGLSRRAILEQVDASLRRLGTNYIDVYYVHRFDEETPVEETMAALDVLVRAGKVRYLGASSMWAWQFAKMLYAADRLRLTRFVTMQNHYNLVYREEEREMIPLCRDEGVGLLPWSPLARGFLAGNRRAEGYGDTERAKTDDLAQRYYYQPSDFAIVDRVTEIAAKRGVPNAQIALAWILRQPGVTAPVIGASKMRHLDDAVAALDIGLDDSELNALAESYQPHPVLGHS